MRVLRQLITLFWQRGAITLDQAHYFVEHGFVRSEDLPDYHPRAQDAESDSGADKSGRPAPRPPSLPILPDVLDEAETKLAEEPEVKRKRRKQTPKIPDLTPEELGERLEAILKARAACFPALVELARPDYSRRDERMAAVVLRHVEEGQFPRRLLRAVRARPAILAQLWECVDDQPFHDLVAQEGVKGKAVRGLAAILCSCQPGLWGPGAWALQIPAVQSVANLLAVRWRLLRAVTWLYDNHWSALARCLQRPPRPRRSWDGLGFGMVLLYNARAWLRQRTPPGFVLEKRLTGHGWREAWTNAVSLDPVAVTPYLIHVFGKIPDPTDPEAEDLSGREDVELICPSEWKV
jgi:hypothetical protein